jgi:hypothetical protein
MTTQRSEVEAWLGDGHGLDDRQVAEIQRQADQIAARYPDPDDEDARGTALMVAYRVLTYEDPELVVADLGEKLSRNRRERRAVMVQLEQAASMLVEPPEARPKGVRSQSGFATLAGVDRMTVLKWLGLR